MILTLSFALLLTLAVMRLHPSAGNLATCEALPRLSIEEHDALLTPQTSDVPSLRIWSPDSTTDRPRPRFRSGQIYLPAVLHIRWRLESRTLIAAGHDGEQEIEPADVPVVARRAA